MSKIFEYYKNGEYAPQTRISYFGWEGKGIYGFYNYILGYRKTSEVIYNEFKEASINGRIDEQDTLGFPLCFNYRQSIELYMKYFFLKYGAKDDKEFSDFLIKVGHSLYKSWEIVRPILDNLLSRQEISDKQLSIVDNYISEWHNFDKNSMRMRYPISKFGQAMNPKGLRLDIVNLKDKMDAFFTLLDQLDYDIDNQVNNFPLNKEDEVKIICNYNSIALKIDEIIKLRSNEKEFEEMQLIYRKYYSYFDLNQKVILGLLYLSADDVLTERCKLAKNVSERKIDFCKVILSNMEEATLYFDDESSNVEYVFDKVFGTYSYLSIKRLKFAKEIMNEEF